MMAEWRRSGRDSVVTVKEAHDLLRQPVRISQLAFPYREHAPTKSGQSMSGSLVASAVPCKFVHPVRAPSFRYAAPSTTVHVPEASADIDDFPQARQHQVRLARQV